jgi:hypothetical protein
MDVNDQIRAKIQELIAGIAREQFPNASIESVRVIEDTDADGEPIYQVFVVFQDASELERANTSSFVRHVAPKLEEMDDFHFPLVNFVTSAEARKVLAAA